MMSKRLLCAAAGGLVLCMLLSLCDFYGRCASVRENVVRLHILANSDSKEDQALKLQVRDAVLEASDGWLSDADTVDEARAVAGERLPQLREVAQQTVTDAGYDYAVNATLCTMYFPTREYDAVTLPAGMYEAVRFTIGSGEGKNWWCVVYPPLCVGAAIQGDTVRDVLDTKQADVVTGGRRFIVRFKVVEWWEKLLRLTQ